ncbi:MAG: DUF4038 domain-containing protein [Caldilineaceae bacterium]|nr:DUF4038 domain-containing protein [Caldilineaceae bacterium]
MSVDPWHEYEIILTSSQDVANPYTDVEVAVEYVHESGLTLQRPAFWDGGRIWKARFASPGMPGEWTWRSRSIPQVNGLDYQTGEFSCRPATNPPNRFYRHGFWRMSSGGRSLVHADGTAAILAADTAWALPWRATVEQCRIYAADRRAKGFNGVLLMSVQPDMHARGSRNRSADEGFDVGFEDLQDGRLNQLNPAYFQYFDRLIDVLIAHEIVPIYQPVFMGFGWKGLEVAGPVVLPQEYARYCRYLVARYGARPALYLVGGDGSGYEAQVPAGGEEIERQDAYRQPTGIHYRPHADNRAHQDADWLDFQWCQTGHSGEHIPERVMDMWRNTPVKGVANGEPSYENTGAPGLAAGWWQGHEAWSNLCAGGTMGVFYGAAGLWQWRLHPDEPGHAEYFLAEGAGWREALDYGGSAYVGMVARILDGLPTADMAPNWQVSLGRRGLLTPGVLYIGYLAAGGPMKIFSDGEVPLPYRVYDPLTGEVIRRGVRAAPDDWIPDDGGGPRVYICYAEWS